MSESERKARAERLAALRGAGLDPYPARVGPLLRLAEIRRHHDTKDAAALDAAALHVCVAGRVLAIRSFGKLVFMTLFEDGVQLQASFRKPELSPEVLALLALVDVGDFVRAEGVLWRTRTGELTVGARALAVVAKCLHPLPEKWHGLVDVESALPPALSRPAGEPRGARASRSRVRARSPRCAPSSTAAASSRSRRPFCSRSTAAPRRAPS